MAESPPGTPILIVASEQIVLCCLFLASFSNFLGLSFESWVGLGIANFTVDGLRQPFLLVCCGSTFKCGPMFGLCVGWGFRAWHAVESLGSFA